ncbi:metallopeptidase-like protein [Thermochaetoides thermophila DSM 1495]|uniref:Disintegrin and metalloproteinase domain-containing protein B n=1 Tax=Chaetomium thermophilum (strain DSM 1495 / CBS 144.50 / IMI 039719) TaxID=759272 RepID=G0RZW0_CHATD|nr:metallopeptidase-like protein [Thermochaetoides thermophila DSM 1495]EGS23738.1 metallopeptidase-like protein [Thermochaetoides thermophila DSM 1495]
MIFSKALAAIIAVGAGLLQGSLAHSLKRSPLSSVTRLEDAVIHTPSHRVHAHTSFTITFTLPDRQQKVRLALEPNHDIFGADAAIQVLAADGTVRSIEPIDRAAHRVFKGDSFVQQVGSDEWQHVGWTRITVRRDGARPIFDGVFTVHGDNHHIQTKTNYRDTTVTGDPDIDDADDEFMVVWRDSDIQKHGDLKARDAAPICGSDRLEYNRDRSNLFYRSLDEATGESEDTSPWYMSPKMLFGRQFWDNIPGGNGAGVNLISSIGSTAGCPTTRKVALVGIATDCTYTAALKTKEAVQQNVINLVNSASQLYEATFNISLAIQNLTISEPECPNTPPNSAPWNTPCAGVDIEQRLSLFSKWRGQWKDTNAYWTLLTTCNTGPAVGLAWLGAVCQEGSVTRNNNETSAGANVVVRTSTEWLVFAHETGHTFGAVHDCSASTCLDGSVNRQECCPLSRSTCDASAQFIMNPSTGDRITQFSPCSIGNICSFLGRSPNRMSCLTSNRGVTTFTASQCGNGIVEKGEDCDCGGDEGCANNPCCDPQTCKYTAGSVCDPSNEECCTPQCQFMPAGSICRQSTGPCDPQEVCSGTSAGCPADEAAPDGQECGEPGAGLTCASGRCTSRDQQCKTFLSGSVANGNETTSCSSSGCDLSCASPRLGPQQCYVLNQWFLDGTPCEAGGRCYNGVCKGASATKQFVGWFKDNPQIAIPVACVVGGLIFLALVSCCWSCVCGAARRRRSAARSRARAAAMAAAAALPRSRSSHRRGWSSTAVRGGSVSTAPGAMPMGVVGNVGYAPVPTPPANVVTEPYQYTGWERGRSFRYA